MYKAWATGVSINVFLVNIPECKMERMEESTLWRTFSYRGEVLKLNECTILKALKSKAIFTMHPNGKSKTMRTSHTGPESIDW